MGAGSAGCVLANRLSAEGARVHLLEAGGSDETPLIRIPALYRDLQDSQYDWAYRTVPQAQLNQRRIYCPRGRTLGGSSSINFMMYVRGNRGDYDHWAQLGNRGWSYDDVLPYFIRSEKNGRIGDAYHGADGPMHVNDPRPRNRLSELFVEAAMEAGLPRNDDFNGAKQEGCGYFQATIGPGGRSSTATAFLHAARTRPNLTVTTHALATRVLFEKSRATGVQYLTPDGLQTAFAATEVILCGGAINSPQLLMISGVGPADELRAAGIEVFHDLPGVGRNLQDHLSVRLRYQIAEPLTLFGMSRAEATAAKREFTESGTGVFASNHCEAGAFFSCNPASEFPDTEMVLTPSFGGDPLDGSAPDRHGFQFLAYTNRPESRGTIKVVSSNPLDRPLLDPNYLSAPADLDLALGSLRRMREIGRGETLRSIGATEILPGPEAISDSDLTAYVRRVASTSWHQSGTCKMGVDREAVVDPELRVHGIDRLRVVDASVMPTVPSGNTNAPTIMIAEKGADLILGRRAHSPLQ